MTKKCPVCKGLNLTETMLQDGLLANQCENCHGIWISSTSYFAWLKLHGPDLPTKEADKKIVPQWGTKELKLCPDCGKILSRYKVFPNQEFFLDHCGSCNGVWFDQNEWEYLAAQNLHDNVNSFFTKPWQKHIHEEETKVVLDKLYLERFGEDDYARLKEFQKWLASHPQRSMMLAYLQADDPYKV